MKEDLFMCHMGNGISVSDKKVEVHGDYKKLAHIDPDRSISWYVKRLSKEAREEIQNTAYFGNMNISQTQKSKVLHPSFEEIYKDDFKSFEPRLSIPNSLNTRIFFYTKNFEVISAETFSEELMNRLRSKTKDFFKMEYPNKVKIECWSESLRICLSSINTKISVMYFDNRQSYQSALEKSETIFKQLNSNK